jgi:hypothetical protein
VSIKQPGDWLAFRNWDFPLCAEWNAVFESRAAAETGFQWFADLPNLRS